MSTYKLYEFATSGNCYKIRLAMSLLGFDYERIAVDITKGESRTEAFLKINANGRVPVLQTGDGHCLPESNAALWYLAYDSDLLPEERLHQAQKRPKGYAALDVMERHLKDHEFFVGDRFTIADIALYAYTHVAHEGGFDLASYSAIDAWFKRIEALPNYVTIEQ